MASAFAAINAKIRSQPILNYVCSTHFWGPVSNFGIPLAAIADARKDPEIISGNMTLALSLYSATFMRYALAISPKNYLLFGCHLINFGSQNIQGYRYVQYWHNGGRERSLAEGVKGVVEEGKGVVREVGAKGEEVKAKVEGAVGGGKR